VPEQSDPGNDQCQTIVTQEMTSAPMVWPRKTPRDPGICGQQDDFPRPIGVLDGHRPISVVPGMISRKWWVKWSLGVHSEEPV